MFKSSIRLTVLIALVVVFVVGCTYTVTLVDQPGGVEDGAQFDVEVTIEYTDDGGWQGFNFEGLVAIMVPDSFVFDSGTYDAGATGSGNAVDASADPNYYPPDYSAQGHPLPAGYMWVLLKTDTTYLADNMGVETVVWSLTFTANEPPKAGSFTMSYVGGVFSTDYVSGGYYTDLATDCEWDVPINISEVPTITDQYPADGSSGIDIGVHPGCHWQDDVSINTGNSTFTLTNGGSVSGTLNVDDTDPTDVVVEFVPDSPLDNGTVYTITTHTEDDDGLSTDDTWSFTTVPVGVESASLGEIKALYR